MQLRAKDGIVEILIDRVTYAIIEYVDVIDDLDVEKVANWVNETCYNDDHLSSAYVPPYLDFKEFKLD